MFFSFKKKLLYRTAFVIVISIVIFIIWSIWFVPYKPPQFFPFNESSAEYSIVKNSTGDVFMVKYKGPDIFSAIAKDSDGSISVIVGKSKYDLNQYLGKKVFLIKGDFSSSSKQCIFNNCKNINGPHVVVNIETMKIVKKANLQDETANKESRSISYSLENKTYTLLVAETPKQWEKGLMYFRKPQQFDGMLFIFPDASVKTFWNKNTFMDLDLYWLKGKNLVGKSYLPSIEKSGKIVEVTSPKDVDKVIEVIK